MGGQAVREPVAITAVRVLQFVQPSIQRMHVQVAVDDDGSIVEIRAFEADGGGAIDRRERQVAEAQSKCGDG